MRRSLQLFLVTILGSTTSLLSYQACIPPDARLEVGAEAIAWRPRVCDTHYIIMDERSRETIIEAASFSADENEDSPIADLKGKKRPVLPQGQLATVDCKYNWGWRLNAAYVNRCTCFDVRVQYTWLHGVQQNEAVPMLDRVFWPSSGQPRDIEGPLVNGDEKWNQNPFKATAGVKNNYDSFDLETGWRGLSTCYCWARLFAGLHAVHIHHRFRRHYEGFIPPALAKGSTGQNLDVTFTDTSTLWAVGPRFGAEAQAEVYSGFGVSGRFAAGILAGNQRGKQFASGVLTKPGNPLCKKPDPNIALKVREPVTTRVVPFINVRLGITHVWCCGKDFLVVGEAGYEFFSYIDAVSRLTFNDKAATADTACQSLDIDGFYFSLRLVL